MPAQIRIDQEGLPEGTPGVSRTDGLDTGALVTLTNTGSGSTTAFRLLWVPPGDTTAVATLEPTDDPRVWTFAPTPGVYGSYRVELVENQGLTTERKPTRRCSVAPRAQAAARPCRLPGPKSQTLCQRSHRGTPTCR